MKTNRITKLQENMSRSLKTNQNISSSNSWQIKANQNILASNSWQLKANQNILAPNSWQIKANQNILASNSWQIKANQNMSSPPLIIPNLQRWDFYKRLKNEFETAVVNETSVFEPLKFYCIGVELMSIQLAVRSLRITIL